MHRLVYRRPNRGDPAFCTFSKTRTSIWRTRDTPNSLGQHVLFLPVQHREPLDFLKNAGFGRKDTYRSGAGHSQGLSVSKHQGA